MHPKNPVEALPLESLGRIFRGEVGSWSELSGFDLPITLYGRQTNSGTFLFFREAVVGGDYAAGMRNLNGNAQIVEAIRSDPGGIGYVGLGYVVKDDEVIQGVEVLSIEGDHGQRIDPRDRQSILRGDYPISRPLFQYHKLPLREEVLRFLAFELKLIAARRSSPRRAFTRPRRGRAHESARRGGKRSEIAASWIFTIAGWTAVAVLLGVLSILVFNSIAAFRDIGLLSLVADESWNPNPYESEEGRYSILAMLAGTGFVTLGAMVLAVPVGIGASAFLSEFCPAPLREVLKPAIELLAAVPSVVIGFVGITVVGPLLAELFGSNNTLTAANGAVLLAAMSLPTIVSIGDDAISAVPPSQRNASYALGAGRFTTLLRVVLPNARGGLIAAIMLGLGRAVGETMTVLMATGNALAFPDGLMSSVRTLTATIAIEMGEVPRGTTHYSMLFLLGLVLFTLTLAFNLIADHFLGRREG
ncbi:MAG: phosphate ABC transporter permease subunit PstC [Myxococcales bacterium]|nr:phosphate ABC transporter permease subunit PstC [Myxococcales bacterium]